MSDSFRALRLNKTDDGQSHEIIEMGEDALMDGDVTVAVSHSTLNYKDGLALTGAFPVVRAWPMIPGIDFAGTVESSDNAQFQPGDEVILNGWGVGRLILGASLKKPALTGIGLSSGPTIFLRARNGYRHSGYTAMLCVMAIEPGTPTDAERFW